MNNSNFETPSEVLKKQQRIYVDNNIDSKNTNNHVSNVENSTIEEILNLFSKRFADNKAKNDWVAQTLADKLNDKKSINYYKYVAKNYPISLLFECLSIAIDTQRSGRIKTTVARYFTGILKKKVGKKRVEK